MALSTPHAPQPHAVLTLTLSVTPFLAAASTMVRVSEKAIAKRLADWRAMHVSLQKSWFWLRGPPEYEASCGKQVLRWPSREFLDVVEQAQAFLRQGGIDGLLQMKYLAYEQYGISCLSLGPAIMIDAALSGRPLDYHAAPRLLTQPQPSGLAISLFSSQARYCSKAQQQADWTQHEKVCAKLAAEAEGARSDSSRHLQLSKPPAQRRRQRQPSEEWQGDGGWESRTTKNADGTYTFQTRRKCEGSGSRGGNDVQAGGSSNRVAAWRPAASPGMLVATSPTPSAEDEKQ
eukprot:scaffold6.g2619.t1